MFSGIVETQARVLASRAEQGLVIIDVERPSEFTDLHIGDSVCTNGVCLTVESLDAGVTEPGRAAPGAGQIRFALAAETLKVTGWTADSLRGSRVNLERSLSLGARIHGHMVSGHVDGVGEVVGFTDLGGSFQLDVRAPKDLLHYIWKKGGWAVNGVSLTINSVVKSGRDGVVSHCLIPETLRRTNLGAIGVGDRVNLEVDMMARGLVQFLEASVESGAFADLVSQMAQEKK